MSPDRVGASGPHVVLIGAPGAGKTTVGTRIAERLATVGPVMANAWIVRADVEDGIRLSVFADGRAIVTGTREESRARAIVARYLGA